MVPEISSCLAHDIDTLETLEKRACLGCRKYVLVVIISADPADLRCVFVLVEEDDATEAVVRALRAGCRGKRPAENLMDAPVRLLTGYAAVDNAMALTARRELVAALLAVSAGLSRGSHIVGRGRGGCGRIHGLMLGVADHNKI